MSYHQILHIVIFLYVFLWRISPLLDSNCYNTTQSQDLLTTDKLVYFRFRDSLYRVAAILFSL